VLIEPYAYGPIAETRLNGHSGGSGASAGEAVRRAAQAEARRGRGLPAEHRDVARAGKGARRCLGRGRALAGCRRCVRRSSWSCCQPRMAGAARRSPRRTSWWHFPAQHRQRERVISGEPDDAAAIEEALRVIGVNEPQRYCTDRYPHPLGRWPRHTRSRVSAGTDRPARQERRTRLNKRAPMGPRGRTRCPTTDNRTGPSAFETTRPRVRSPPPPRRHPDTATRHGPGLEPARPRRRRLVSRSSDYVTSTLNMPCHPEKSRRHRLNAWG